MIFVHTSHVTLGSKIHTLRYEGFKRVWDIPTSEFLRDFSRAESDKILICQRVSFCKKRRVSRQMLTAPMSEERKEKLRENCIQMNGAESA